MPPHWNRSIAVLRLANNISPVLFRKADWHGLEGYGAFTKWKALKRYKLETRRSTERLTLEASSLFDLVSFYIPRSVTSLLMRSWRVGVTLFLICSAGLASESRLPFGTVFKGQDQFNRLVAKAKAENWKSLPIGDRTAAVGKALIGTRYKHFTLEIDNRIESPSVNFYGMDCWTFFETALGFARMLNEPESNWTPERLLHYIEMDRYRGGQCTGDYLSRLHYLEDWLYDNDRRGLVNDMTRQLGGRSVPHSAREMTVGWRHYRYLAANRSLLGPLARMEANVSSRPLYEIPKSQVSKIEPKLRSGDVIGVISRERNGLRSTAHVGLAIRTSDGVLHFMHASSPSNYGKVVVDDQLSKYLYRYGSDSGILVGRPLR
jgi:N-acetylmuramoyl-L-alanine amidase-like